MLSRRELLLGAGATAIAGAAGLAGTAAAVDPRRRDALLHRLGLLDSPDHHVPASGTPTDTGTLASAFMPGPVGWTVSRPAGPVAGVVYCLHGKGGDHRFAFDTIRLPDVVAATGGGLVVAAVDGGPGSYWHARRDGRDPQAMLLREFVPLVEARTGTTARALLGWSMGGYGALLAAETTPDRFRAVAAASPAVATSFGAAPAGAFDGPGDYRAHDVFARTAALAPVTVRIDCGTGDPFHEAARRFASLLPHPPTGTFGTGFHDAAYWRSVAPGQIATVRRALRSAG